MTDTQAVVNEADGQAKPVTEVDDAQDNDSLENALSEFDKTEEADTSAERKPNQDSEPSKLDKAEADSMLAELRAEREQSLRERTRADIDVSVETIDGTLREAGVVLPKRFVRGALNDYANDDPRLARAFSERKTNPKAWTRVLKTVAGEMAKEASSSADPEATRDRDSVTAAVRNASTTTRNPQPANLGDMSDAEFARFKESNLR
jgi:hypothetical protein